MAKKNNKRIELKSEKKISSKKDIDNSIKTFQNLNELKKFLHINFSESKLKQLKSKYPNHELKTVYNKKIDKYQLIKVEKKELKESLYEKE